MKNIVIILLIIANISCTSQNDKKIDITGNWYNYNKSKSPNISYIETFFSENTFYSFDDNFGIKQSLKYIIEGDKMYLMLHDEDVKNDYSKIKIVNNVLEIDVNGTIVKFKKINNKNNTLQKYIDNQITEYKYKVEGFWKRKAYWEEHGVLKE